MNNNLDPNGSHLSKAEKDLENVLRPDAFSSFAGQEKVVENLRVFVKAAAQRGEALFFLFPINCGIFTANNCKRLTVCNLL